MASFLSILKSTVGFVEKEKPVIGGILTMLNPAIGTIFNTVLSSMAVAEKTFSTPGSGVQKAEFVVGQFDTGLSVAKEILALEGKTLTYDQAKLTALITAQNTAMNALADLKESFKIV